MKRSCMKPSSTPKPGWRRFAVVGAILATLSPVVASGRGCDTAAMEKDLTPAVESSGNAISSWMVADRNTQSRPQKNYQEWNSLSPEEKAKMRQRMQQLKKMPPRDRQQFDHIFDKWRQIPPEEQRRIQQNLEKWDTLPEQEKQSIRGKFRE